MAFFKSISLIIVKSILWPPDYLFIQSIVHLEQIQIKEDKVPAVASHLQEVMTLLGMYPLSRLVSDQFLIYLCIRYPI